VWFQLLMKGSITMMLSFKIPLIFLLPEQLFAGSSSMNILNCITSSQINGWENIRISRGIAFPQGKKWACIYSVKKNIHCCTNWRKFRSLYLIWTCYLLYPLEKITIFEPLNCKNRELNTKEGKEILLVWIVMNLENDRWIICMQISEENHLSL